MLTVTSTLVSMANLNRDTLIPSSTALKHHVSLKLEQTLQQYNAINFANDETYTCFCVSAPTHTCVHAYLCSGPSEYKDMTLTTVLCWFWCCCRGNWFSLPSVQTKPVVTGCSLELTNLYSPQPSLENQAEMFYWCTSSIHKA